MATVMATKGNSDRVSEFLRRNARKPRTRKSQRPENFCPGLRKKYRHGDIPKVVRLHFNHPRGEGIASSSSGYTRIFF
jgi:hypothetical protein